MLHVTTLHSCIMLLVWQGQNDQGQKQHVSDYASTNHINHETIITVYYKNTQLLPDFLHRPPGEIETQFWRRPSRGPSRSDLDGRLIRTLEPGPDDSSRTFLESVQSGNWGGIAAIWLPQPQDQIGKTPTRILRITPQGYYGIGVILIWRTIPQP